MKPTFPLHAIRAFALMAATLLPLATLAGGTATIESDGQTSTIHWQDNGNLRMGLGQADGYLIVREGTPYTVINRDGTPMVMDMSGMLQAFADMGGEATDTSNPFGSIDAVKATGSSETVAGIQGQVYQITVTDADGQEQTMDTVLTGDALVQEMTQAYMNGVQAMLGSDEIEKVFLDKLPADQRGLLRAGDDFQIVSISGDMPSADLFVLPAEPKSLGSMMQKAMQGMQN